MTYPQAQDYLNSFINYERLNRYPYQSSFKLERLRRLLHLLGNPQKRLQAVHVAGSKGKGSTCAFAASILREAGRKVGLYTSPHLVDVRERIRILEKTEREKISPKKFARLTERIKPAAEKLRKTRLGQLSYYEVLTALAFLYFVEGKCDFVVLETGIGGRLDATNVVSSLVCAITPISYEHTQVLGASLEKIAAEKAGIIKESRQIVLTAPQGPAALKIIRRRARQVGADLFEVGRDIRIKPRSFSISGQSFDLQGILGRYSRLHIGLLGKHQIANAALAIGCVEALADYGVKLTQEALRQGLKKARWPGRLQIICGKPRIILDAAHNRASAGVLKEALNRLFKFRRLILVLGISCDKDVRGILAELLPLAERIILTKSQNPRALAPEAIKAWIKTNSKTVILTHDSKQALKVARQGARGQDLIVVCGSLFLIGEVLKKASNNRLWRGVASF